MSDGGDLKRRYEEMSDDERSELLGHITWAVLYGILGLALFVFMIACIVMNMPFGALIFLILMVASFVGSYKANGRAEKIIERG